MNKYFLYIPASLLIFISLNLSAVAVKIDKQKAEKNLNRAIELIDLIAKNALIGDLPTSEQIYELKYLTPYLGGSKKYAELNETLKQIPAKKEPKTKEEKAAYAKYSKPGLKPEDIKIEEVKTETTKTEPAKNK